MKKLYPLIIFGIAFGLLEAIVVFYLQQILGLNFQSNFEQLSATGYKVLLNLKIIAFILPIRPILNNMQMTSIEVLREATTIIMLLSFAYLAGESIRQRIGAFLIASGVWDIFYYVFLSLITGWPRSIFDIDIFFLIPFPWIGPIITPIVSSVVMIVIGVNMYSQERQKKKV